MCPLTSTLKNDHRDAKKAMQRVFEVLLEAYGFSLLFFHLFSWCTRFFLFHWDCMFNPEIFVPHFFFSLFPFGLHGRLTRYSLSPTEKIDRHPVANSSPFRLPRFLYSFLSVFSPETLPSTCFSSPFVSFSIPLLFARPLFPSARHSDQTTKRKFIGIPYQGERRRPISSSFL